MNDKLKTTSKFLSLVLRHSPQTIGIELDENGWVSTEELIRKANQHRQQLNIELLKEVVANNDKKRFSFNETGTKIRANQGHSISVDLQLQPVEPPAFLFHGTVAKFLDAIKKEGLKKMNRQHLHLSNDEETAIKVGSRRGNPIILTIASGKMHNDGYHFYLSANGVWLCDQVPSKYINFNP